MGHWVTQCDGCEEGIAGQGRAGQGPWSSQPSRGSALPTFLTAVSILTLVYSCVLSRCSRAIYQRHTIKATVGKIYSRSGAEPGG